MANIIIKKYEHINSALPNWDTPRGKYIRNKRQYFDELKKANMISYEKAKDILRTKDKAFLNRKLTPSKDTLDIIKYAQEHEKKGKVKFSGRAIDKMVKLGVVQDRDVFYKRLPKHYQEKTKGGFDNEPTT